MSTLRAGSQASVLLFWFATACSVRAQWLPQNPGLFEDQVMKGNLFLEAFMHSDFVERRYLSPRIGIVTPARSMSFPAHQYRPIPIGLLDNDYVLNDGSREEVHATIARLAQEGFRIDWRRISSGAGPADDRGPRTGVAYGPSGWLIFEQKSDCWQLVEGDSDL